MILDEIVANKRRELDVSKNRLPLVDLERAALKQLPPLDFAAALRGDEVRLIAEVKKASPSKGVIRARFNPLQIARAYVRNGAAALSILTDEKYFQGKLHYIPAVKTSLGKEIIPILRKDFIIDPYQVYESRASGADAILLIVSILPPPQLKELLALSLSMGMASLVEVHNESEIKTALRAGARLIGINNRDLSSMTVDINVTQRLRPLIPRDRIVVSESGIRNRRDILQLKQLGINAVLIGEALMAAPNIAGKIRELLGTG